MNDKQDDKSNTGQKIRRIILFILLALMLVLIFIGAWVIGAEEIVERIGITNGYIVAFVVAFFAGFSAVTAIPFYTILITLISGGLNPLYLGILAGVSLSIGDMFLFYFGRQGREMIGGRADRAISRMASYFNKEKRFSYIPLFSYVYISFIPLPNDWLLLFLASIRFPVRRMYLIIALGDFTHICIITYLAARGIELYG